MKGPIEKNYNVEASKWGNSFGLKGPNVFHRYIMLLFLDELSKKSDDFVFKGGNLLWHYIKTPRETADLDFVTLTKNSHDEVNKIIQQIETDGEGLAFSLESFEKIEKKGHLGARVKIKYRTKQNKGLFRIDIVYAIPTEIKKIKSSLGSNILINASCIEEIISDKVMTCYKFKSGNTRLKDFDDLWRIAKSNPPIDNKKINLLFRKKEAQFILPIDWIKFPLENGWKKHAKKYKDLPDDIKIVFEEINVWLKAISKIKT